MVKPGLNRELLGHIGFWLVFTLIPLLKSIARQTAYSLPSEVNDLLFGLLAFYSAFYLFNWKRKRLWHILPLGILFIILGFLNFQIHNYIFKGTHQEVFLRHYAIGYVSTYCLLASFAYLLFSIKKSHLQSLHLQEVIREKERAELAQLKSQINPHFLFNTLNAIYSSAENNKDKTPDLILKLSDNFRYIFSEAHKEKVALSKEIKHLKNYIFLQKERLGNKVEVNFIEDIDNYDQMIAPLVLMTFVENMFKHTSKIKGSQHKLEIHIKLNQSLLELSCKNPYNESMTEQESVTSGLGIETTLKRLELSYPNKHKLNITQVEEVYKVQLKLQL